MLKRLRRLARILAIGANVAIGEPMRAALRFRTPRRDSLVWSPNPGEKVLLSDVEIIDVVGGVTLHRRGLLIQDGRIGDIFTEKQAASVKTDRVIDGKGMFVIPGLINAHCHMLLPSVVNFDPSVIAAIPRQKERNFEECITHGVTAVRDAGSMPLLLRRYIDRIEGGSLLGPRDRKSVV